MTKHQHCPLCHFEGHCLLAGDVGHSSCVNGGQSQVVKRIFKANRLRHSGTATIGQYGQGRAFGQMVATHTFFKVHHKVLFHCSCLCPQTVCKGKQGQIAKDVVLSSAKDSVKVYGVCAEFFYCALDSKSAVCVIFLWIVADDFHSLWS